MDKSLNEKYYINAKFPKFNHSAYLRHLILGNAYLSIRRIIYAIYSQIVKNFFSRQQRK